MGGGTLWGVICEADPVSAGVLIRRLIVERIGEEVSLTPPHQENLLFALDEHPENVAIYEVFSRCPALRSSFAKAERPLERIVEAMEKLRSLFLQSEPQARLETDRGCVGRTSGVYGVRDSDAYFVEADLLHAVLDLLLSAECHCLPARACQEESSLLALRRLCMLSLDIGGLLKEHPRALASITAFLSSAVPIAFHPQLCRPLSATGGDEELWTLLHLMVTSSFCSFLEDVLNACATSRMHDESDLRAIRAAVFGHGVSKDARHDRRAALCNVRLALCHCLLLLFNTMALLHHTVGMPARFVNHVTSLYKARLLPLLQNVEGSPLSSRWPEVRQAVRSLATAVEGSPVCGEDIDRLNAAHATFRSFAARRFLVSENVRDEAAAAQLDPFGGDVVMPEVQTVFHAAQKSSANARPYKGLEIAAAERPRIVAEKASYQQDSGITTGKACLPPMVAQPRRFEMRFMKLNQGVAAGTSSKDTREKFPAKVDVDPIVGYAGPGGSDLSSLPQPLPLGSAALLRTTGRSALVRSKGPPLETAASPRGCFFNSVSSEYIS